MKEKIIVMTALVFLSHATSVCAGDAASDIEEPSMHSADQLSMVGGHAAGFHGSSTAGSDQSFWSEQQNKQAELEAKYQSEIAENPDNARPYAHLAGLYLMNNKTSRAIEAYQDAITHDPENAKLFAAISVAYLHEAKYPMAQAMAAEALRLDPTLEQVKKINAYIDAKQDAIEAASKVSQDDVTRARSGSGMDLSTGMPVDAVHGNSNALRDKNISEWTH